MALTLTAGTLLPPGVNAQALYPPPSQARAAPLPVPPRSTVSQPLRISQIYQTPRFSDREADPALDPAQAGEGAPPVRMDRPVSIFLAPDATQPAVARGRFAEGEVHAAVLALIETRQPQKAYERLAMLEAQYSGDAEFDYLYGLAALESGRASEAVFSLQRAANADSRFAAARLEFARALYVTGDDAEARREFQALLKSNPPREAELAIRRYLAAIEERAARYEPRLRGTVELEAGYDSNANSGTKVDRFLNIPLDAESRESGSAYYGAALAGHYSHPLTPRIRWRSSLRLGHREYPDAEFISSSGALGSTELAYGVGRSSFSLGLIAAAQLLRDDLNQTLYALALRGALPLTQSGILSAGLRAGLAQYGEGFRDAEVQQWLADLNWLWRPQAASWQADAGVFYGADDGDDVPSLTRDLYGVQLGATVAVREYPLRAAAGWLSSRYAVVGGLPQRREDQQASVRLSTDLPGLLGKWIVSPQISYIDNQSNLSIYDYNRIDAGVSITRGVP